jgi:hypothetical protein
LGKEAAVLLRKDFKINKNFFFILKKSTKLLPSAEFHLRIISRAEKRKNFILIFFLKQNIKLKKVLFWKL